MRMNHFAIAAAFVAAVGTASAQTLPLYFSFDAPYTNGALVGQQGWNGSGSPPSTVNPIAVGATGLTYTGYQSAGGSVFLTDNGEDAGLSLAAEITPATGNTYYYSLMLRHDGTDVGNTTGDYFAHLTGTTAATSGNFRGRLFGRQGTTTTDLELGLRYGSNDTITYSGVNIPPNTTAFAVVKITEVAGADNDTAQLFVFVAPAAIPAAEPGSAQVSISNSAVNSAQDIANTNQAIGRVGIRQGSAAAAPKLTVDEIRVATTWADILPPIAPSSVSDWTMFN